MATLSLVTKSPEEVEALGRAGWERHEPRRSDYGFHTMKWNVGHRGWPPSMPVSASGIRDDMIPDRVKEREPWLRRGWMYRVALTPADEAGGELHVL